MKTAGVDKQTQGCGRFGEQAGALCASKLSPFGENPFCDEAIYFKPPLFAKCLSFE